MTALQNPDAIRHFQSLCDACQSLASRYHERFADHVVDISAKVSYLTTGTWNETE
jgi:hypothetical protein